MDVSKYLTVVDAAKAIGVSRWWVYRLAKKYNWRTETILGKRVYLKRDVMKTPVSRERRAEGQRQRYMNKSKSDEANQQSD